jgi:hypothetical protein
MARQDCNKSPRFAVRNHFETEAPFCLSINSESGRLVQVYGSDFKAYYIEVETEVQTSVVMTNSIFWDITPCIPVNANRRFGGTYRLHLQDLRVLQVPACFMLVSCLYCFSTLNVEAM